MIFAGTSSEISVIEVRRVRGVHSAVTRRKIGAFPAVCGMHVLVCAGQALFPGHVVRAAPGFSRCVQIGSLPFVPEYILLLTGRGVLILGMNRIL